MMRFPLVLALSLFTASTALAYNFTQSNGTWYITCNNGERGHLDGSTPVGTAGDTGNTTVHGIAHNFCGSRGGIQAIGPCPTAAKCKAAKALLPKDKKSAP